MRLFIQYATTGEILSASKIAVMDQSLPHPFGFLANCDDVLEIELTDQLHELECHEISEQYLVNTSLSLELKTQANKAG